MAPYVKYKVMSTILLRNFNSLNGRVDILIKNKLIDKIVPTGSVSFDEEGVEIINGDNKFVLPSFINMHIHAAMSPMKGVGEDKQLLDWLAQVWRIEEKVDEEFVYIFTKLACLEMIKSGTTTYNDQYWHIQSSEKAAIEMGLRPMLSYVFLDHLDEEKAAQQRLECEQMYEKSKNWDEKAKFIVSVHSPYSVCESSIIWARDFVKAHNLLLHIHVSETETEIKNSIAKHKKSPVKYLDDLSVLSDNVIAAHTLWLSDEDVEILGKRGVTCVHNVNSNLKLASGYRFRYNELKAAGANICLGTDGCGSSDNLDMLEVMKTSSFLQKSWRGDPSAMPIPDLMEMVGVNAAKVLGLNSGRFEEGANADLIIVNTDSYHFISKSSFLSNFIYSAHSDSIDSVICDGRFLMKNRVVEGEREIIENAREYLMKLKF